MKVAVFSAHNFEKNYLLASNAEKHELTLLNEQLNIDTAEKAKGCEAVSIFVSDDASAPVLEKLHVYGIKFLLLRSAGFNHVDISKAATLGMKVARVPGYSPHAVAEHAVALMLALNRKLIPAHHRVEDNNFSLDGLVGFDMNGKTVGIIGTGKIGTVAARILNGFGCRLLAFDKLVSETLKKEKVVTYTDLDTLLEQSDIITLHLPLTGDSTYIINRDSIAKMKQGVMLINTGRGRLVNTQAVIDGIKTGKISSFGADVYEKEEGLFFEDHSEEMLQDDVLARLLAFKNVIVTGHQAFLTDTALDNIARTTIHNISCFEKNDVSGNELT